MAGRGAILPVVVLVVAGVGGLGGWWLTREAPVEEVSAYDASRDCLEEDQVRYERRILCPGTPIEVSKHAGIGSVSIDSTTYRIVIDAGRTGTVVRSAPSPVTGEPSVAVVQWEAQDWPLEDGTTVSLPAFEHTTHADHLRLIK